MAVLSPIILLPTTLSTLRASSLSTLISGTADPVTTDIFYTYAIKDDGQPSFPAPSAAQTSGITLAAPVTMLETELPWSFDTGVISLAYGKVVQLVFWAKNSNNNEISLTTTISVSFSKPQDIYVLSPVPSGLYVDRKNYALTVFNEAIVLNDTAQSFIGFNYYVTIDSGNSYVRMNRDYVTSPTKVDRQNGRVTTTTSLSGEVSVDTVVTEFKDVNYYSFSLDKKVLNDLISAGKLPSTTYNEATTFYFVVTSVVYDQSTMEVGESLYSSEIGARFINFVSTFQELPTRTRDDIVQTMATRMMTLNPALNILAGGVIRDQVDPVAEEFSDYYVVQDFISRAQSLDGLVSFDDANGDGISDPVPSSIDKQRLQNALRLPNDNLVQGLIDAYFDKYAANFNISRLPSTFAIGQVLFYTNTVPTEGMVIDDGATLASKSDLSRGRVSIQFRVKGRKQLAYADREHYYNKTKRRYEITADIEAVASGSSGNVNAGEIVQILSGADLRFKVLNTTSTYNGRTTESNLSLANRTRLAIAGVDSGTEPGYALQALSVGGVAYVRVEKSGDPLMRRDIDPATGTHIGGKVDVYVQGSAPIQVQDTFAFAFSGPEGTNQGDRFYVEDATSFRIRTNTPAVTAATPIFDVVRVTNATRGLSYDVSGAVSGLGDGDTIELAMNATNLAIGMATLDVIEVDYRYRGSNSLILSRQPVESLVTVVGDIDGTLPPENYRLIKLEDPLLNGNSTIASDGVALQYFNGLPTQNLQTVTGEAHVMTMDRNAVLTKKGVDTDTLVVSSDLAGLIPYVKELDYKVAKGGDSQNTEVLLVSNGKIRSGATVYMAYQCGQNFTVTYTVNNLLQNVQAKIEAMRHATADVAVKQAFRNEVDIAVRVIRVRGTSEADVTNAIATNLTARIQNLKLGQSLNLDDVVNTIKNTANVRTVTLPLLRMMKKNGSFIPDDKIGSVDFTVYNQNMGRGVTSYLSTNPVLSYGTVDKGGDTDLFRAIYENGTPLVLVDSPLAVSAASGRGYIQADGRIVVSTTDGAPPQMKNFSAAYYTFVPPDQEYTDDIVVDDMEHLVVGATSLTIDASSEEQVTRRGL